MKKTTGLVDLLLQSDIMKKTYTLENKRLDTNNSLIVESNFLFQTMIFKGPQALSFQECRLSRFFLWKEIFSKSPGVSHRILTTSIWTRPHPVEHIFGWQVFMGRNPGGKWEKPL